MKISVRKDTHTGTQPIRVLKHNLTHRLVERNENLIKQLQSDFKLDKEIRYHIAELPLIDRQTPFVDENGQINIHETFLSYIWSISFCVFVLHEEGIAIPDQIRLGNPLHKKHNPDLINVAKEVFDYAKSLVMVFSEWDKEVLPNPEYYDSTSDEGWYIERTNDLYVEAVNFILYHEVAHAKLEHISKIETNNYTNNELKELELEADTLAIRIMLENCRSTLSTGLSLIIGLASMFFSSRSKKGGKEHPDIDVRIENLIKLISPEDEHPIWPLLVIFMKLWDEQFTFNFSHKTHYQNYREFYYELIKQAR
ncbi:phage exclusion protein Lit family protein [Saccharicrinis sp. 156]|uniref:phage exclusion protein Lit family protein n=1 Tax=Saccharicrinis sp. 156 TaxID=3417574 RepID=UPI003D33142F